VRRLFSIATLAVLLLTTAAWSQMRGHGGFSGGHGGFSGRAGFHGSGVGFRGTGFGFRGGFGRGFGTGFGRPSFAGRFHHHRGFFNGGFGFPFFGYSAVYAYPYDYGYYSTPVADYSYPSYGAYNYYSDQQRGVEERLDRLEDRVDRLRDEERYRAEAQATRPRAPSSSTGESRPAVLVFRDRHTEEVQNYGIVGQTLWVFNEQRARKIPLASLDLVATTKVNEDRGVDFQVPSAGRN